jgi:hypothetical protein
MIALTAVKNRDNEVYSVTTSWWTWVWMRPAVLRLIRRGVIKGTMTVGHFHLHQGHLYFDGF